MCGDHRLLLLVNEPGRREAEAGAVHAASTEGSREATGTSGAADSTHSAGTGHYSEELGLLQREDTAFLYFSKQFSPTFYYSFYFKTLFETFEILWEVMTEFKLKHEYFKDTTLDQYLIAVCENIGLKTRFVGFFFFFFFASFPTSPRQSPVFVLGMMFRVLKLELLLSLYTDDTLRALSNVKFAFFPFLHYSSPHLLTTVVA